EFRVQVQALARFYGRFFLTFAWHNVAPWPSVYASHTKVRIGSGIGALPAFIFSLMQWFAQLTCREPVWPQDIERTCNAETSNNELPA
ncbi:hypothetical protein KTE65_10000, partial [Burkholderia multivorans]|nr:hypothetical protein [Burkholderia multivorans]